jgi:nicotinate-nucleotide pyrophosphorylase (carboxylating)
MDVRFALFHEFFTIQRSALLLSSVETALAEDGPDVASRAVLGDAPVIAEVVAKEETLIAGLPLFSLILDAVELGSSKNVVYHHEDCATVPPGTVVASFEGAALTALTAERTFLNFLCHMSGIANLTKRYVDKLAGSTTSLLDTRKTLPGLRLVEKYAVLVGGGKNHRLSLTDMYMLKDNHVDAAGGITPAVEKLRAATAGDVPKIPIEVECRSLDEVREAAATGVERIMLDNMSPSEISEALALIPDTIESEVSGGVSLETIGELGRLGADYVSVGRVTHSAPAADFSMRMRTA